MRYFCLLPLPTAVNDSCGLLNCHREKQRNEPMRLIVPDRYLEFFNFTELHLDSVIKYQPSAEHSYAAVDPYSSPGRCVRVRDALPDSLFKHCPNVTVLSLRHNFLEEVSPHVGRLSKLKKLYLTNNRYRILYWCRFKSTAM